MASLDTPPVPAEPSTADRASSREAALKAAIAALQAATAALQYVAQPEAPEAAPQDSNLSVQPVEHEPVVPPEPAIN
jgi:hypothetical protein